MTRPFIILINGPPGAGKDTLGDHLVRVIPGLLKVKFSDHLKRAAHYLHGIHDAVDDPDAFEGMKDHPSPSFFGQTPRAAYIALSEQCMKPLHGTSVFGRILLRRMRAIKAPDTRGFVITDSGFVEEATPLLDHYGRDHALLIRIHADKRGCTFKNDSRSYIILDKVYTIEAINNDKTPHLFLSDITAVVKYRFYDVTAAVKYRFYTTEKTT